MLAVFLEKCERFHHPTIEAVVGVAQNFASEMRAIFDPTQIAARRQGRDFAIAFIAS